MKLRRLAPLVALCVMSAARSADAPQCVLEDLRCEMPNNGPAVLVSARVYPEGFGLRVLVLHGSWEKPIAVTFAINYAEEVMADRKWCMKGYELEITESDKASVLKLLCK